MLLRGTTIEGRDITKLVGVPVAMPRASGGEAAGKGTPADGARGAGDGEATSAAAADTVARGRARLAAAGLTLTQPATRYRSPR